MSRRVCLIVDNPLRDLEGLVLLGWHLAGMGIEAYLVPMYTQGFDVLAIKPDLVLANYARSNNIDLLRRYRAAGMRVGILDSEGAAGKNADEYAQMVARMQCGQFVDLYCVWGVEQFEAFGRYGTVPKSVLRLTGCPRYDFCAHPWRAALPRPKGGEGCILVNTNFPVVNPRFSRGTDAEQQAMVRAGFSEDFARRFVHDARDAHRTVIDVVARLAKHLPGENFVVRPHPFEDSSSYDRLAQLPNIQVRQEGTSLEWIHSAKLLIHQNCSTAIEAVMLGREPVSLEWFNTPALLIPGPNRVSCHASSEVELESVVRSILGGEAPVLGPQQLAARQEVIRAYYFANDGLASQRVAEAMVEALQKNGEGTPTALGHTSARSTAVHAARRVLGYRVFENTRRYFVDPSVERRRDAKRFTTEQIQAILGRLIMMCGGRKSARATCLDSSDYFRPRLASGQAVRITAT